MEEVETADSMPGKNAERRIDGQTTNKMKTNTEDKYDTDWWFAAMYNMKEEKIDAVQVKQFSDDLPVCCFQSLIELLSEVNETWRSGFKKGVSLLNFNSVCLCLSVSCSSLSYSFSVYEFMCQLLSQL